ncbi:tyrosine-protein phosphatase non-receptor type 2 [Eurytemora carolleeae]|uniref:tyrosine-protein phosphatase non-receptor type 2 n=1 Tax=Eurytemora carolleeae TaxID=1294199 RepID=UPI000C7787FD|nr:tyrosine-protein phosphatase non-receptor type 2 [Eurytemora carolleeae]|eukprot:XP_023327790.1 tyrosine-protein phosphatase non-receptor type 2-like [Eurytemora affinis]
MAATASMFHKSRGATQDLEKEFKKTNFKNMFFEIGLQEATSDKFSNLTTLSADEFSNKPLNRYYNVLAYDQTRVKIQLDRRDIYINANHVRIPDSGREYILTQGPLEQTVDHFWLMCHQHKTTCIVMLCRCYENSREKSAKYWPTEVGETFR